VEEAAAEEFDAVVVPGGYAPDHVRRHPPMTEFVRQMKEAGKPIAVICHGGWVPASAGAVRGRTATSFFAIRDDMVDAGAEWVDQEVVRDGNLVSSRTPQDLPAFGRAIIAALKES
jgi:protease I